MLIAGKTGAESPTARVRGVGGAGRAATARAARLVAVLVIGLGVWVAPEPPAVDPRAWHLLAIFIATVSGIMLKPLPMSAIAVTGLSVAVGTRTLTLNEALSGFSNSVVWLVMSAFAIALGFIKTGLGDRIAYRLVAWCGGSTLGLGYSLAATDFVLAPVIASNTARAGGVIFPILQSICRSTIETDPAGGRRTSAFLTLTALHANLLSSSMFLTAIATNPMIVQLAANQGIRISWGLWALAASVPGLLSFIVAPLIIRRLCPPGTDRTPEAAPLARAALARRGPMTRQEWTMAAIAVSLITAWILGPAIGLDSTVAALIGFSALLVTGVVNWNDVSRDHEAWNTFVWFSTLVMMATFLGQLGLIGWFSKGVSAQFAGVGWVRGFLGLSLVYFYSHYFFASTTAHVSAMYGPFLGVSLAAGAPPLLAAMVLGFFSSLYCGLTHYSTAPAPILFGNGYVPLTTWWKVGAVLSAVYIAIWLGVGGLWWRVLGIW
jgi:DASS family divalent anion:Na+ symporter